MKCPKCKSEHLIPSKLEHDLPAMGCTKCEGAFVSLLYYRDWVERTVASCEGGESKKAEVAQDTQTALTCPKCQKLMTKYKISGCSNNRLDLCGSCDEAWLDGGEWELLKSIELSKKMPAVFTEEWQRKLRKQASEESREQKLLVLVGEKDVEKAKEARNWLRKHPNKPEILFFINHE